MSENYQDSEGAPIALESLCRREPDWAASRIRVMTSQLATAKADALKAARDAVVISCPECCRHIDKTDEDGCCLVCGTDVVHDGNGAAYDWWLTVCAIDQLLHAATNPRNP